MIKDGGGDGGVAVVYGAYAEEVGYDGVNCGGFLESPGDCGGVVATRSRRTPRWVSADARKDDLLEDEGGELKVGVGDAALWVVEADKIGHDVVWPLEPPDVVLAVRVGVEPDPAGPLT